MAEAKLYKGRAITAYVNGEAVDSNGEVIEGAPKQPKDTDPSQQPHVMAALNTEERSAEVLAKAFASALKGGAAKGTSDQSAEADIGALPPVRDLADAIGKLDAAEVKAMQKRDDRATAEPIYKARLTELE